MALLTYEQWDAIADAYIPLLGGLSLLCLANTGRISGLSKALGEAVAMGLSVTYVYLLMWIDGVFSLWHALGLDYSTHTALAWVLVIYLSFTGTKALLFSGLSLCLYGGLMAYQQYHSLADMLTTSLVIVPPVFFLLRPLMFRHPPAGIDRR